jgi:hypothetical protein
MHSNEEIELSKLLKQVIITAQIGMKHISLDTISGLAAASDENWPTLRDYSNSLIPRSRWPNEQVRWYGFDTDDDFIYLSAEVEKKVLSIQYHAWSNRYYLINTDGSHRIAALYKQNYEQNRGFVLSKEVTEHRLDVDLLSIILTKYYIIITSEFTAMKLAKILQNIDITCLFHDEFQYTYDDYRKVIAIEKANAATLKKIINYLKTINKDKLFIVNDFFHC